MTPAPPLHAWVDESVHVGSGLYILAAAVAPAQDTALKLRRERLRALVRHARPRLHWNAEERRDRIAITDAIAAMPLTNVVVTATQLEKKRQERARRKCLEQLLHKLAADGVSQVWLESRDAASNRRDLGMVAALRSGHVIPPSIYVDFGRPLDEPLLWIPDAVAGAVAAAYRDEPLYRAKLEHMLDETIIEL